MEVLIKKTAQYILIFCILSICTTLNVVSQNTPTNATHLLSISEGLTAPFRIAVNSEGVIYVTDVRQNNVVKYDISFNLIGTLSVGSKPRSIAINSLDEIFIGDAAGIIYKLDELGNPEVFSTVPNHPLSMIFDKNNQLYIVDSKLKQVTVLDENGNFVRSIGAGDFVHPVAITYNSQNEKLFISEHGGIGDDIGWFNGYPLTKIWIFDTEGNEIGEIGEGGSDDGEFYKIQGTNTSQFGTFFVVDPYQADISIFDGNGNYLSRFGEYGSDIGNLNIPMDVVFDKQGRTIVTSMNTGTIEVYYVNEINPTYEITTTNSVICPGGNTDLSVDFTGTGPWTFTYTIDGLNPVTVTDTYSDPYVFNVTEAGLYEVTAMSDANLNAVDFSSKVTLTANPFPTSNIISEDVEICYGTSTDISINFTGVAPFRFRYTDGTTTTPYIVLDTNSYIINATGEATYQVTNLEGAGGCLAQDLSDIVNIGVNSLPSSLITSEDVVICEGSTTDIVIEFTGNAPWTFTYSIDGIDQAPVTTGDNPYLLTTGTEGVYSITALSDANNTGICMTGSTNISVTPLPTSNISSSDITICENESATVDIDLTGSGPWNLTYTIDSINPVTISDINTSTYTIDVQESGLYEVTAISGNACNGTIMSGNSNVIINHLPSSDFSLGSSTMFICEGDTKDLILNLQGEAPWTYTYTIDDLNPTTVVSNNSINTITASEVGTYKVVETSDANCTNFEATGSPTIRYKSSPTAIITSGDVTLCEGETTDIVVELTGTAPWSITYLKNGKNPTTVNTSINPFLLSASEAGTYTISQLSDANSIGTCLFGEATISVNEKPTSLISSIFGEICVGETKNIAIKFTGTAPWIFTYTVDGINPTTLTSSESTYMLNTAIAGTYEIIALADANCTGTSMIGSQTIIVNAMPIANLGQDISICQGEIATLDAGTFYDYSWNDGSTGQTLEVSTAGTYTVNVTDDNGCSDTDEIFVTVNPLPISDFSFTKNNLEISFSNYSENADSYLWDFGDNNTSIETEPVHNYQTPGTYNVSLSAFNDLCGDSIVVKTISIISSSAESTYSDDKIKVYPNPSEGLITIDLKNSIYFEINLEIFNLSGQRVYSKLLNSQNSEMHIDLRSLPKGIYTLNLISEYWIQSQKIILIN